MKSPSIKRIRKIIKKLENVEDSWACKIEERDASGNILKRPTHLRSVPPNTGKLLKSLVISTNSKKILELGCSGGYSSLWMSMGAIKTRGHIYTTEVIYEKIIFAKQNFKDAGVESLITLNEGDIFETLNDWTYGKMDMVFIDADKKQYSNYYLKIFPLVKKGGLIIADNMLTHAEHLKEFTRILEQDKRISFEIISLDSGLLIACKN